MAAFATSAVGAGAAAAAPPPDMGSACQTPFDKVLKYGFRSDVLFKGTYFNGAGMMAACVDQSYATKGISVRVAGSLSVRFSKCEVRVRRISAGSDFSKADCFGSPSGVVLTMTDVRANQLISFEAMVYDKDVQKIRYTFWVKVKMRS